MSNAIKKLTNTSEHVENYRKVQVLNVTADPYTVIDEELKPIIDLLNSVKGVVTTDSCASHPTAEKPKHRLYFAFMVDEVGFEFISELTNRLSYYIHSNELTSPLLAQLQLSHRLRRIAKEYRVMGHVWTLSFYVPNEAVKQIMLGLVARAVKGVINDG